MPQTCRNLTRFWRDLWGFRQVGRRSLKMYSKLQRPGRFGDGWHVDRRDHVACLAHIRRKLKPEKTSVDYAAPKERSRACHAAPTVVVRFPTGSQANVNRVPSLKFWPSTRRAWPWQPGYLMPTMSQSQTSEVAWKTAANVSPLGKKRTATGTPPSGNGGDVTVETRRPVDISQRLTTG